MAKITPIYYLGAAFLTALILNSFVFFYAPGIGVFLATLILIQLYEIGKFVLNGKVKVNFYQLLIVPILFFSGVFALRTNEFVLFLSFLTQLILIPAYLVLSANPSYFKSISEFEIFELALKMFISPFEALPGNIKKLIGARPKSIPVRSGSKFFAKSVLGVFITAPLLLIVLGLLTAADPVFSKVLDNTFSFIIPDLNLGWVFEFIFSLVIASGIWFYISGFLEAKILKKTSLQSEKYSATYNENVIPVIIIYSLSAVYMLFVAVQFAYLFGGENFIKDQGLIVSEYAIKGFWEMIFVALINYIVLYALISRISLSKMSAKLILMPGYILILGSTLVMLLSAHTKLSLYESIFGYSIDRLIPHTFMIYVAAIIVLLLLTLALADSMRRKVIIYGTFIMSIVFLVGFSVFNMERFVVERNVAKFNADPDGLLLDIDYLFTLGTEGHTQLGEELIDGNLEKYFVKAKVENKNFEYNRYCDRDCALMSIDSRAEIDSFHRKGWQSWNLQSLRLQERNKQLQQKSE